MSLLAFMQSRSVKSLRSTALAFAVLCTGALPGKAQTVTPSVSQNPIMVGQPAEYTISFSGIENLPNMLKPRVDGLRFSDTPSTGQFNSIINGVISSEQRLTWAFSALREGRFTIPGRTVQVDGKALEIPPVTVDVVPQSEELRSRALLQLQTPQGPFYVGQAIEARLVLLVRADINISNISFPERNGEAFSNTEFNAEPLRSRTRVDGRIYNAFVWDIVLTPIKSGSTELSFSQSLAIQVQRSNDRFNSIFSFNMTRPESLTVQTDIIETEILPLPTENQPEGFNGAIGEFSLTTDLSSDTLKVGEPLTLTLRLSGKGNFDRISAPIIPESDDWKLYPPKAEFIPSEASKIEGTKAFEYILIPQSTNPTELPEIPFSFFETASQTYRSITPPTIPVEIAPADPSAAPAVFSANGSNETEITIPEALLPIRPSLGRFQPLTPLWQQALFLRSHLAIAILLAASAFLLRRRKALREDHHLARRHAGGRRVRKALKEAEAAAKASDAQAFFSAARTAIQHSAAKAGPQSAEAHSLVASDCLERLAAAGLPETDLNACRQLLDAADAHHFAGQTPSAESLQELCKGLLSATTSINKKLR